MTPSGIGVESHPGAGLATDKNAKVLFRQRWRQSNDREKNMEYKNFTSLPPEQEQSFVVYERTSIESAKKAFTVGAICGGIVGVLAIFFYMAFDPPKNAHAVDPEPKSELKEEAAPEPAPAPAPAEEAAPEEEEAPAEEAAPAEAAPAEGETAAAPEPPKGATKAPPTALVGQ